MIVSLWSLIKESLLMSKVLFVCMGNICRSPAAEGIFKKLVSDVKLENEISIDSAGTINYHTGELPDVRMRRHALIERLQFRTPCKTI